MAMAGGLPVPKASSLIALFCASLAIVEAAFGVASASGRLKPDVQAPKRSLNLLRTRWHWKEASDESKTEWGIVLKRFFMADTLLWQFEHHVREALPGEATEGPPALDKARAKLQKVAANLDEAKGDQDTSDSTFGDMQVDKSLTDAERLTLREQYKTEQHGFFAADTSGREALRLARELVDLVSSNDSKSKSVPLHGNSTAHDVAVVNATGAAARPGSSPGDAFDQAFRKYQDSAATFHSAVTAFETDQHRALANLLALHVVVKRPALSS